MAAPLDERRASRLAASSRSLRTRGERARQRRRRARFGLEAGERRYARISDERARHGRRDDGPRASRGGGGELLLVATRPGGLWRQTGSQMGRDLGSAAATNRVAGLISDVVELAEVPERFACWLAGRPLAERSRREYARNVRALHVARADAGPRGLVGRPAARSACARSRGARLSPLPPSGEAGGGVDGEPGAGVAGCAVPVPRAGAAERAAQEAHPGRAAGVGRGRPAGAAARRRGRAGQGAGAGDVDVVHRAADLRNGRAGRRRHPDHRAEGRARRLGQGRAAT